MSKPFFVVDVSYMLDALKDYASYDACDLNLGELHAFIDGYIVCPKFETELKEIIASRFDCFIENELDDYRAEMIEGTKADDAYEKHRQKQIDEDEA